MAPTIWLISGIPGSGKTSLAMALCARFTPALRIHGDDLRDMVVSGSVSGLDAWTPEHSRQFSLSWRTEASIAKRYAEAGFTVVIDDVVSEEDIERDFVPELDAHELRKVLLRPALDVALARNRERTDKPFDPARLASVIRRVYLTLAEDVDGWTVIDNSDLTTEQTVDAVLSAWALAPRRASGPEGPR